MFARSVVWSSQVVIRASPFMHTTTTTTTTTTTIITTTNLLFLLLLRPIRH